MKSTTIFLVFAFTTLVACKNSPSYLHEDDYVSFTCPKNWKITEKEFYDGGGFYSVEDNGFDSSGLMTLSWADGEYDLNEQIIIYSEDLKANFVLKNSNLSFERIVDSKFNNAKSRESSYTMELLGLKHEGRIVAFHLKNKTVVIIIQSALEDKTMNDIKFEVIEKSLVLH